jgi:hypothetical protein
MVRLGQGGHGKQAEMQAAAAKRTKIEKVRKPAPAAARPRKRTIGPCVQPPPEGFILQSQRVAMTESVYPELLWASVSAPLSDPCGAWVLAQSGCFQGEGAGVLRACW